MWVFMKGLLHMPIERCRLPSRNLNGRLLIPIFLGQSWMELIQPYLHIRLSSRTPGGFRGIQGKFPWSIKMVLRGGIGSHTSKSFLELLIEPFSILILRGSSWEFASPNQFQFRTAKNSMFWNICSDVLLGLSSNSKKTLSSKLFYDAKEINSVQTRSLGTDRILTWLSKRIRNLEKQHEGILKNPF